MLPVVLATIALAGCDWFNRDKDNSGSTPTTPSNPTVSINTFAGTWNSVTASTPPTGCGNVKYTVTPASATTATVQFNATCTGNIAVNGTGTGTLSGSTLEWSGGGIVAQGNVNCPFTFTNGKAATDASGQLVVTYSGTVCGIAVSGAETVKK